MTQDKAASQVGVSRATFAQWETGRHLPAEARVHDLDRLLGAGGELVAAARQARPTSRLRPVEAAEPAAATGQRSLLQVLNATRRAFLDQLQVDETGQPVGWRHNLVPSGEPPSTLSTAYGLKVLALLGGPDARTPAVVEAVMKRAIRDDAGRIVGWGARNAPPRAASTAAALDGLLLAGAPIPTDDVVRMLGDLFDETAREHPFTLASALEPLLRVAPDSDFTLEIVQALLDSRREFDGVLLWPEKILRRDQPLLEPSLAHTARAVTVLRNAPEEAVGDAVRSAEQWIAESDNLSGVSEVIRRTVSSDQAEELTIHHFTSAWVARALAGTANPDRQRISNALGHVWARYDPQSHFWAWGNGDVPVWMLADAVGALRDSALAAYPTPVVATPDLR